MARDPLGRCDSIKWIIKNGLIFFDFYLYLTFLLLSVVIHHVFSRGQKFTDRVNIVLARNSASLIVLKLLLVLIETFQNFIDIEGSSGVRELLLPPYKPVAHSIVVSCSLWHRAAGLHLVLQESLLVDQSIGLSVTWLRFFFQVTDQCFLWFRPS